MASPTQRTLAFLREEGYDAAVVERYLTIPGRHIGVRQDAFGFIDILAFDDGSSVVAVQATSTSNMGARVNKILASPVAARWIQAYPFRHIWVIGWKKYAKPVGRKWWRHTIRYLHQEDFDAAARRQQSDQPATVS